ncbi:hypothetical protein, variant 2 [Blastomyces dermatitidis ER-3]|uniref:Putative gamma-glutamylcyclotransferase n=3 Tax=Blastomyces TaxID=229219 RepID=A0A179UT64_BLAGS|nr:hypothetical protein, variant 2 [Blastomyces gilchristii SLH14081]XP_031579228.1 uncharacterized protein BDBG_05912 [Blastomyces gilchristii SLH14081]XP_031579229.1 hypothetical protein, variant 1 [Blastomyces gilchristii SLH14081]XP_045277167.1 hypothetical protein, variant 1 [Blastomyces dermatitidis ER-3]XP_045281298.1 uncharacterized protein BDCG_05551 [Blastomyces dermatitidis ER-3]XP_045281299.1 hypothetical protein, variant 2 [Blastomyces dermatitidis ER-3]EGE83876.1 hypothetical pr
MESSRDGTAPQIDPPWKTTYLFVYGSLMDLDVLQHVLALPSPPPPLRAAKLRNYKMKMWGPYPTLIPKPSSSNGSRTEGGEGVDAAADDDAIPGKLYLVEHPAQFTLLERYETKAYAWRRCVAEFTDDNGSTSTTEQSGFECRTFVWAGDPDSSELSDGPVFDLERYQKHFKPKFLTR